jgi:cytochrome c553
LGIVKLFNLCFGVAVSIVLIGCAAAQAAEPREPQKAPEPYAPGLGDFMTAYVQTHHIKVGLAGSAKNWPLAEYEAKELRETFEDVSTYQGMWHDFPIAKLVETNLLPPLDKLDAAIKAKNAADFKKAYGEVTAACNTCHQATGNEFVAIKTPSGQDFPDQEFQPR